MTVVGEKDGRRDKGGSAKLRASATGKESELQRKGSECALLSIVEYSCADAAGWLGWVMQQVAVQY